VLINILIFKQIYIYIFKDLKFNTKLLIQNIFAKLAVAIWLANARCDRQSWLVGWSLTSLFGTNTAISETSVTDKIDYLWSNGH